jgi:hypothetical protein
MLVLNDDNQFLCNQETEVVAIISGLYSAIIFIICIISGQLVDKCDTLKRHQFVFDTYHMLALRFQYRHYCFLTAFIEDETLSQHIIRQRFRDLFHLVYYIVSLPSYLQTDRFLM